MSDEPLEVNVRESSDLARDGAQIVDVREQDEWDAGRIPGAVHIPMGELSQRAGELDPTRPVVFQCLSGGRSLMAAQAFRGAGFDAYSMEGGLLAWDAEGLPLEPEGGTVASH